MAELSRNALTPLAAILELVFWPPFLWLANLTARVLTPCGGLAAAAGRVGQLGPASADAVGSSRLARVACGLRRPGPGRIARRRRRLAAADLGPIAKRPRLATAGMARNPRIVHLARHGGLRHGRRDRAAGGPRLSAGRPDRAVDAIVAVPWPWRVCRFWPSESRSCAAPAKAAGASRLAGTCVALLGGMVMLAALALAWPWPGWMLAVGGFDAAVLAWAGFRWRLPPLSAAAIACAADPPISPRSTLPTAILRRPIAGS